MTAVRLSTPDMLDPALVAPPEWGTVEPELLARLLPRATTAVEAGGRTAVFDTTGIVTPEQHRQILAIARGRWFLLRNDGPELERLTCGRCKRKHEYFTLACVERPFHGLQEIVGLLRRQAGDTGAFDALLGRYVRLGTIEPITRKKALQLGKRIEGRGERL